MNDLVPVDFHGDTIWAGRGVRNTTTFDDGAVLVAIKPICETLGIDWKGQMQRIKREPILSEGVRVTRMPSAGGGQETVCLPLNLLPGFLFGIRSSRVADPAARERVVAYQRECYSVLYQHFFGRAAERQARVARSEMRDKLKAVSTAMQLSTRAAARNVWNELGLPHLPDGLDPPMTRRGQVRTDAAGIDFAAAPGEDPRLIAVRQFVAERLELHEGAEIGNAEMHQAYVDRAKANGAPWLRHNSFGLFTKRLRLKKVHTGDRRLYRGYRLKPAVKETLQ